MTIDHNPLWFWYRFDKRFEQATVTLQAVSKSVCLIDDIVHSLQELTL